MHVISRKKLREFWRQHTEAEEPLSAWFKVVELADWERWADVTQTYLKASYYHCCLIFNICGGDYPLLVHRLLNWRTLFVVAVMTHAEYDRNAWQKFCTCR